MPKLASRMRQQRLEKTTETHGNLNQKTMYDLSTAMHGEAFAYVKYLLYAEHARKNGNNELADLFERTANTERFEHFAEEARTRRVSWQRC